MKSTAKQILTPVLVQVCNPVLDLYSLGQEKIKVIEKKVTQEHKGDFLDTRGNKQSPFFPTI